VNIYVPGCAPKPEAIIDAVAKLLKTEKEVASSGQH
jgi:NADH:ubiquinone oxidoreductase subunit B-like Fe-S oxidoreductase